MPSETMVGFGYKVGWLAVRDGTVTEVVRVLGGQVLGLVPWHEGVERSYAETDLVVITPPLRGADGGDWLLVAGTWMLYQADAGSLDTATLSAALGREVQLFGSHRIVDFRRWDRAVGGRLVRSFEYLGEVGEVRRWHGDPDDVERAVGLPAAIADEIMVYEEDVMRVAAGWSVDPCTLDGHPATAPLTAVRLPAADRPSPPRRPPVAVNVTELIVARVSIKEFNAESARRLRRAQRRQRLRWLFKR